MEDGSLNIRLCAYMLALIDQSNYSINRIAELSDISQSHLNQILTKQKPLSQAYIEKICKVLKITPEDFYQGALSAEYSYDELMMHSVIHDIDETLYPAVLQMLQSIQQAVPKRNSGQ